MTQWPNVTIENKTTNIPYNTSPPAMPPTPADPTGTNRPKEKNKTESKGQTQASKGKTGPADPQKGPTHTF